MSVVVKNGEGKLFLMVKGAQEQMLERMKNLREPSDLIYDELKDLNIKGFRTLMFGYKEID